MKAQIPRTVLLCLSLLLLVVSASPAPAEPAEAVPSIKARYERERQNLSARLRTQKVELMKLMAVESPQSEKIKLKVDQILETERHRQHLFVDEMFAVRASMTEEEWSDYRRAIIMMMMNRQLK